MSASALTAPLTTPIPGAPAGYEIYGPWVFRGPAPDAGHLCQAVGLGLSALGASTLYLQQSWDGETVHGTVPGLDGTQIGGVATGAADTLTVTGRTWAPWVRVALDVTALAALGSRAVLLTYAPGGLPARGGPAYSPSPGYEWPIPRTLAGAPDWPAAAGAWAAYLAANPSAVDGRARALVGGRLHLTNAAGAPIPARGDAVGRAVIAGREAVQSVVPLAGIAGGVTTYAPSADGFDLGEVTWADVQVQYQITIGSTSVWSVDWSPDRITWRPVHEIGGTAGGALNRSSVSLEARNGDFCGRYARASITVGVQQGAGTYFALSVRGRT